MKHYEQVRFTSAATSCLNVAMDIYENATKAWHIIENDKLPEGYTQEQYEGFQQERSLLFNNMQYAMTEARRYHDLYMTEESKLNQMGRMKKDGF